MNTPHKHAALIKQWADDPSQDVWYWSDWSNKWVCDSPEPKWYLDTQYALGPKPTQPPRKMCVLAGVEFPAPETKPPEIGTRIFFASMVRTDWTYEYSYGWKGTCEGEQLLFNHGLVHLTREAAEQHSRALMAANKAAIEEAR